ncbi:uncharacterized protein F4807DRAFT_357856 [Annulohypoxylon truncatum]|uniref:uncharacterized protein n=1 Tax=Annulohypoxylon truncatum TaxID=327061 RepID=UPI002007D5D0|nr:uncharacterized protein F4807DRAFT_357856 [Annulohypoxylon truncatum]KAI1204182.1 hypothetical protein F4807DRAFT_357856 [Annulohypoxylon truncatum]
MSTTRVGIRDAAETLSRIAIANAGSAAGDYRDPSWMWPPPLHQPYCRLHFLKECSLYHLKENESFKRMIETCTTNHDKPRKWPAAPTRIQPARRAREKTWKDQSGIQAESRNSSPSRGDKSDRSPTTLETWCQQLQLHLPWPIYKTRIEAQIERHSNGIIRGDQPESSQELGFQCRYCKFDPEVIDFQGSAPRRLAPPAPMHFILPSDMRDAQITGFGGLKFVVDVSDGKETIVLLIMDRLEDFTGHPEKVEPVEELKSAKGIKSRKRRSVVESADSDEPASATPKKRRRRGGE